MSDIRIQKTGEPGILQTSDGRLPLSVPIQIKRRSGHRWLVLLESGEARSLKEIATRQGIDNSYASRMVSLTTLAPDIVAAILDDALPNHIALFDLAIDPPALWDEQRERVWL
ncbi:MAG: LacI family transcriptional regulator [Alcanivoracaceae bacterium]